jgi:hypothetical protein
MPLRDHFQQPLADDYPWESVHSTWATTLAGRLNHGILPAGYYALPQVKFGGQVEIDVANVQQPSVDPGAATAAWAPPPPGLTALLDFTEVDVIEVRVFRRLGGPQLRGTIELVSPRNKDRPAARLAFATKVASYLNQAIGVLVVDVITERQANLHEEIARHLGLALEPWQSPTNLYAIAYRTFPQGDHFQLEAWPEPLRLGEKLPTMPLWLDVDFSIPVPLEETYQASCETLLISD